jgi:hypothetical protein
MMARAPAAQVSKRCKAGLREWATTIARQTQTPAAAAPEGGGGGGGGESFLRVHWVAVPKALHARRANRRRRRRRRRCLRGLAACTSGRGGAQVRGAGRAGWRDGGRGRAAGASPSIVVAAWHAAIPGRGVSTGVSSSPIYIDASSACSCLLRVRVEIMGPGKYESVGKSQSVLIMNDPFRPLGRLRACGCRRCWRWGRRSSCSAGRLSRSGAGSCAAAALQVGGGDWVGVPRGLGRRA